MAFGAIGVGIGAFIGGSAATALAAGTIASVVVGVVASAVVGAAIGGLVAAVSGGDIGEGMLYGAVGGLAIGAAFGAGIGAALEGGVGAGTVAGGATSEGLVSGAVVESGNLYVTGATYGAGVTGESVAGGVAGAAAAEGTSWGMGLAMAGASGLEKVYEGEQAKDAMEYKAEQERLQREWQSAENDKALASAEARASGASAQPFYLAEKQALADQQYAATAKLSEDESARRIEEYKAKLEGDEGVLSAARDRAAGGILGVDVGTTGDYVEGSTINEQVADADVNTYDEYKIEATV